jgi:hypothetical protein
MTVFDFRTGEPVQPEIPVLALPCGLCGRRDREVCFSAELDADVCLRCYLRDARGAKA